MILGDSKLVESKEDFLVGMSRVFFLAGLFMVSLLVFRLGNSITVGDLLLGVSALLLIASPARAHQHMPILSFVLVGSFLCLLGGLLSTVNAEDYSASLQVLFRILYLSAILPWQALSLLRSQKYLVWATAAFALGAALSAGGTILQLVLGGSAIPGGMVTNVGRHSGFTSNVSDVGGIAVFAVIIGTAGLASKRGIKFSVVSTVVLISGASGLALSGSVSGMIASVLGLVLLIWGRVIGLKTLVTIAVSTALIVALVGNFLLETGTVLSPLERLLQTTGAVDNDPSLNTSESRLDSIRLGLDGFRSSPLFGAGLDGESSYVVDTRSVHNILAAAAYQGGILLLLGIIVPVISYLVLWFRGADKSRLSMVIFACGLAAILFAMTAPSLHNRYYWIPLALLAAQIQSGSAKKFSEGEIEKYPAN